MNLQSEIDTVQDTVSEVEETTLAEKDIRSNLHPYTNHILHEQTGPKTYVQGDGIYIWDEHGNKYIEGLAGLWCTSLGFSERRLIDAATKQMETLPYNHSFAGRTAPVVSELADKLISIAPRPMSKAYFVTSGSEAVDSAIKFTWYYNNALGRPEKKKIISREKGYHGVTIAATSLTAIPVIQNAFDAPLSQFKQTGTPHYYRFGEDGESEEDFATRRAQELENLIIAEGPETVAALIAEPTMGAGGVIPPPKTYFAKIQEVLRRHDILLIADEVINGFGRTGNPWGCDTYGIVPDMVTCAKQLSSAYFPIGATMISEEIYQVIAEASAKHGVFGTGFTYGGHPVGAAVALETLRIYEERDILGHVRKVMVPFQNRLKEINSHPLVGEARGVGLIGAVELVADKETKQPYDPEMKVALKVYQQCLENGLILRALPSGDTVGICPPLIITEQQIDDLFDALKNALNAVYAELESSNGA